MVTRYHTTAGGPKPCSAHQRPCKYGEHFTDPREAQEAYEATMAVRHPLASARRSPEVAPAERLPATTVVITVKPLAGGRYQGAEVEAATVAPFRRAFSSLVGQEEASLMEEAKAARDRGYRYHLTVVTPPEMKSVTGALTPPPPAITLHYQGLGRAVEGAHEAYFVVCSSPEVAEWREANGLPPKDLHITLGFRGRDVHSQPKGEEALVMRAS